MLDTITYEKQLDGSFIKIVTHREVVETKDIPAEISAIEKQLEDFSIGRSNNSDEQAVIDLSIQNYKDSLAILKS